MLTDHQRKTLNEVHEILKLDFDAFLIVVRSSGEDGKDTVYPAWHAPVTEIAGLATSAVLQAERIMASEGEKSDEDTDEDETANGI